MRKSHISRGEASWHRAREPRRSRPACHQGPERSTWTVRFIPAGSFRGWSVRWGADRVLRSSDLCDEADPAWASARAEDASMVKASASKAQPIPTAGAAPPLIQDVPDPADQSAAARHRGKRRRGPPLRNQLQERRRVIRPLRIRRPAPSRRRRARRAGPVASWPTRPVGSREARKRGARRPATRRGRAFASAPVRGRRWQPSRWHCLLAHSGRHQQDRLTAPAPDRRTARLRCEVRSSGLAARPSLVMAREVARFKLGSSAATEPRIRRTPLANDATNRVTARPLRQPPERQYDLPP